ncbi:MAG: hypothetical protein J6A53_09465 [Clostridia bacterium]|nr:hypothetical protein [Clostridia bacterium]
MNNWIWIKENDINSPFEMVEFKNEYNLQDNTTLRICADTRYELYINGKFLGRGPSSPGGDYIYEKLTYSYYDEYEINDTGVVEIKVIVTSKPTVMNEYSFGYPGLYIELIKDNIIVGKADTSWKCRVLSERLDVLKSDYTLKENDYTEPVFIPNFHKLLPTMIEHLVEEKISPKNFTKTEVKKGEIATLSLDFDEIYSAFTSISIKCNGKVKATIETCELEGIGYIKEEITTDKAIKHTSQRMKSIGECKLTIEHISSEVCIIDDFHIIYSHYPVKNEASFTCSDNLLNKIYDVCMHTLKICRQNTHLDSPTHQEPLACTGDYYIQALMEYLNIYDPSLTAFDIFRTAQILEHQRGKMFHTTYSLMFPIWLYDYHMYTGDKKILKSSKNALECLFSAFDNYVDSENGLLEYAPNYMFVDWIVMKDAPDPYGDARDMMSHGKMDGFSLHHPPKVLGQSVLCMLYYQALVCANKLYLLLNDEKTAEMCLNKAKKVKKAINKHLYDKEKNLYIGGLNTPDKVETNQWLPKNIERVFYLKQANILAVLFDIAPKAQRRKILDYVVKDLRKEEMQPYFYHFLLEAIYKEGLFSKYGLKLIRTYESLVNKTEKGLCEAWEYIICDCSHAWGGAPAYILKKAIAGFEMLEPNYKKIKLSLNLYDLDFADFAISTPYGNIDIKLEKDKQPIISAPEKIKIIF